MTEQEKRIRNELLPQRHAEVTVRIKGAIELLESAKLTGNADLIREGENLIETYRGIQQRLADAIAKYPPIIEQPATKPLAGAFDSIFKKEKTIN